MLGVTDCVYTDLRSAHDVIKTTCRCVQTDLIITHLQFALTYVFHYLNFVSGCRWNLNARCEWGLSEKPAVIKRGETQ